MKRRDIDFLYEMGNLREVRRAWQQVLFGHVANVAEHTFRVTMIAWTIAIEEKADVSRVIKIALVHDIAESRATDIAFMHRDYVTRHEDLAQKDVLKDTTVEKDILDLLHEYEERKTLEAKIVKDADNIDVDLELMELSKNGDSAAKGMQRDHRPTVREKKLYTETAKKIWDEIQTSNPDSWHKALTNKWINNSKAAR